MCLVIGRAHFTPKGVSVRAGPLAINMQPLRGCWNSVRSSMCLVIARAHFTPKGMRIRAGPVAINMQPLRGCRNPGLVAQGYHLTPLAELLRASLLSINLALTGY
jgi:hypothetical protein